MSMHVVETPQAWMPTGSEELAARVEGVQWNFVQRNQAVLHLRFFESRVASRLILRARTSAVWRRQHGRRDLDASTRTA
jgi:hypothetical protein